MAFTRNFLKTMGLTDEQVSAIIEEHTTVTDALKAQRDKFEQDAKALKAEADKVPGLLKQINEAQSGEDYKGKYEKEHQAFEAYKADIKKQAELEKVKAAYRQLLLDERINEKRVDSVLKLTDFSEMKIGDDGKLENVDALKKTIGDEWGEFKVTQRERKQTVATPPTDGTGSGTSRAKELYLNHLKQQGVKVEDTGKE